MIGRTFAISPDGGHFRRRVTRVTSALAVVLVVIPAAVLAFSVAARPIEAQQQQQQQQLQLQQQPARVPAAVLARYVGEYVYPDGAVVAIRLSGDTLFREIPGQRIALWPITETMFQMGPVFTAEFVTGTDGGVTQVLTDGVDIEYRLPRRGARAAPSPSGSSARAPAVRVRRSVLERYVGVYEFVPGQMKRTDLRVVVRLKGDTLMRWMGGQDVALVPISETRFHVGGTLLVTEFVIDERGVTQVLGTGLQQMLARLNPKP